MRKRYDIPIDTTIIGMRECLIFGDRRKRTMRFSSDTMFKSTGLVGLAGVCIAICSPVLADKKHDEKTDTKVVQDQSADIAGPLTLEDAIRIGLKNQHSLAIAQASIVSAKASVTQSKSAYYPQVAPSYSYTNQKTTQTFNGVKQTGVVESGITQIGANLLLFDMGKREENVLASKYSAKSAGFSYTDVRQSVIQNITTSYYEILRRKELVRVAQASVDRAKTTLDATRAFVENGTSPKKDILQAEADYENADVQLSVAKNDVRLAMTTLKQSMSVLSSMPVITPDVKLPTPSANPDTTDIATYVNKAFDKRSGIKRDEATTDTHRHTLKIAHINAGFQVNASITEGYRVDPSPGENRTFNTSFSYPLFDAGSARASVRQAEATLEQAQRQVALTKQGIQADVESNLLTREEARLRIRATQSALRASQENYNAARESQKEGAGTIIDVITAQTQLVTAETNAVQALYDFYIADARFRRAIGENDPYLGGKKP